jgi:hypothetical protein
MVKNIWNALPQKSADRRNIPQSGMTPRIPYETGKSYTYGEPKSMRVAISAQASISESPEPGVPVERRHAISAS